jgi:hypothetical protein
MMSLLFLKQKYVIPCLWEAGVLQGEPGASKIGHSEAKPLKDTLGLLARSLGISKKCLGIFMGSLDLSKRSLAFSEICWGHSKRGQRLSEQCGGKCWSVSSRGQSLA